MGKKTKRKRSSQKATEAPVSEVGMAEVVNELRNIHQDLRDIAHVLKDLRDDPSARREREHDARCRAEANLLLAEEAAPWYGPYSIGYLRDHCHLPELVGMENEEYVRKMALKIDGIEHAGRGNKGVMIRWNVLKARGIDKIGRGKKHPNAAAASKRESPSS